MTSGRHKKREAEEDCGSRAWPVQPQRSPGAWPLVEGKDRSLHKTILLAIVNAVVV